VTVGPASTQAPRATIPRRLARALHGRRRLQVGLLLAGPLGWLVVIYLGSLVVLLAAAFWRIDELSGAVHHGFSLANLRSIGSEHLYRAVTLRTVLTAASVTVADAVVAFPVAFYMAKVASKRTRNVVAVSILLPLWASYLVKVYAWRNMLGASGFLQWAFGPVGWDGPGFGLTATWLVLSYLWLPYMVLPIYAGLERIPDTLVEASADLGGRSFVTFRRVILPLAWPAVAAGSIFTFSLSLGDYIAVSLVGAKTQFLGNVVYSDVTNAGLLPLGAALSLVPIAIMVAYLLAARRSGAFEAI
jgi:putative spermidine/putrescine transport system permease protein